MKTFSATALLMLQFILQSGGFAPSSVAGEAPSFQLNAAVCVSGDGVYLPQLFTTTEPLPAVKLCAAPVFGKSLTLSRAQVCELLTANAADVKTNFSGDAIKISRRTRTFGESDLLGLLTATLQKGYVKDKGQLELKLAQPWNPLVLPDEPLTLDVQELPLAGVAPGFIARFTLRTADETLGTWTANLRAHVWREVCVASRQLKRGDDMSSDVFARERRDILHVRDNLADIAASDSVLEATESIPVGTVLTARMVKARAVVHRGQRADALVQEGALSIRTRVEVMDDGAPGEVVRVRNTNTKRDLTGKVLDAKTILIPL